jgi:hypothetical protein
MALLDVQVAMIANMNMNYLCSGKISHRQGNAHANIVPYPVFKAADGEMVIAVGNDSQFAKLCEIMGCTEFANDERYATNANRVRNREVLIPLLQEIFFPAKRRRMDRHDRTGRRPLRTDQPSRSSLRSSPGASSRHANRSAASHRGEHAHGGQPDQVLRVADRIQDGSAHPGPTHRTYSLKSLWFL